ncbi:MAG: hypothetical protein P8L83_03350 [Flavobacteriaceae bacterium]|nr:hypothetical protein [Flavobacteriaceae bacterium]
MKKFIILGLLTFNGCQSIKNENYLIAKELFENFDNILSPEEYANTIYFYKDLRGLWRNQKDSLVNIYIPYKDNYFSFSNSFLNQNTENEKGTFSRYISKYERGVQIIGYYEIDRCIVNSITYTNPIYVIFLNEKRDVYKCELYSSEGDLIKTSKENFLQQIRRVVN